VLGVDGESARTVSAVVVASLLLATLLLLRPGRAIWLGAGLFALALAVTDVAEVLHQIDISKGRLAATAAAVAVAHTVVVTAAGLLLTSRRPAATSA
jgi:hypothetical protein